MKFEVLLFLFALKFMSASVALGEEDSGPLSFPKWQPISTEYTRTQAADWLDNTRFAVGRWDGSIAVFRKPKPGEFTPVLLATWSTSDGSGVEMIHALGKDKLLASDGSARLDVRETTTWKSLGVATYDQMFGVANSAATTSIDGERIVVTGHASGNILIWVLRDDQLILSKSLDLASPNPIPSPFPIKNIRSLSLWGVHKLIAGSEDGDLTIVNLKTRSIEYRKRYNPTAQRGINSISVSGNYLLLANCSVGRNDKNLWLYKIDNVRGIYLVDSIDLKDDLSRRQSFNFDADLVAFGPNLRFFASTEEGLLWAGIVQADKLVPTRTAFIASEGGALIDLTADGSTVLAAARKVFLFPSSP